MAVEREIILRIKTDMEPFLDAIDATIEEFGAMRAKLQARLAEIEEGSRSSTGSNQ